MATHANSTTAPARPLLPPRGSDGRFAKRAEAPPELPPEPLLQPATIADVRREMEALLAEHATAKHLRRQLAAAVDHGVDLLAALGLPQLVSGEFIRHDTGAIGDALALAIDTLDALDAPGEDLEDDEREIPEDDELSLGWREGVAQLDLGQASDDGEHTLGAPERHPPVRSLGSPDYEPANGSYFNPGRWESQASWAQGARQDGEGEAEAGYDLPCDEDELDGDGSVKGEAGEPSIGWPEDYTAVLSDALQADLDPEFDPTDCLSRFVPAARLQANRDTAGEAERQARALRQRIRIAGGAAHA